ncbi:sarcosine oxidase subunit delta [Amylibacter ulvae]|uniref:Sarcosine oxidase subunit delta n=1 Tax=Paramylibacter ulvae TaxID=1651968 RepID=A0ABQ3D123_9RHOB|nr:sarcosine oxidase subunit delta [Amylibacter ulvae]GHA53154.1 sarcosine oxidase subunit delta [Amylibacter ulvae]
MLILTCPNCGIAADETELHADGQAHITRHGAGASDDDLETYLFMRNNPKGVHFERWRHVYGCGKWFHAARCTMTLEVFGTYPAQTLEPPKELVAKIKKKRPDWEGFVK